MWDQKWKRERERRRRHEEDNTRMDSSTLTECHIGDIPHIPRPDGDVLAVALAARDVAAGVRAGIAGAPFPRPVGQRRTICETDMRNRQRSTTRAHTSKSGSLQFGSRVGRKRRCRFVHHGRRNRHGNGSLQSSSSARASLRLLKRVAIVRMLSQLRCCML